MPTYKPEDVIEALGLKRDPVTGKLAFTYKGLSDDALIANLQYYSRNGGDDRNWFRLREFVENLMAEAARRLE